MKYGKDTISIKINKDGIGEESHFLTKEKETTVSDISDNIELTNYIVETINKNRKMEVVSTPIKIKENIIKLYLNKIIKLISKKSRVQNKKTLRAKISEWLKKQTTVEILDFIKFILIHGFLGASTILAILTMTNIDIIIVSEVKNSLLLSVAVYIAGMGSLYYLFLDINKALEETWRRKKR